MEELKEHTNNALYENYRSEKLTALGVAQDPSVSKRKSAPCTSRNLPRWRPR
jgi:septin family protein